MGQNGAMTSDAVSPALEARIRALEEENAKLNSRQKTRGPWWRALLSALLIVIATILVPVSVVSTWARIQLVDEQAFVSTFAPLVDDAAVQDLIIDEATDAINEQVDFAALTDQVFDGITALGLPPRAEQALDLLRAPAAQGVQGLVDGAVERVIRSDAFSDVWTFTLTGVHRSLTAVATGDGGGILVLDSDGLGIALGPIIEEVKTRLADAGVGVAALIPEINRTVYIGDGQALTQFRAVYALSNVAGWWLPVLTIALFIGGIAIARRRSVAVVGTGVGLFIGGGMLAVGFGIGSAAVSIVAGELELSPSALSVIYGQMTGSMAQSASVVAGLGVLIAIVGWLMGSSSSGTATRRAVSGFNSTVRDSLAARGLNTGGFGRWLARFKVAIRIVLAALAVFWLLALRPLTFSDVLLVIIVTLVVAWVLEILQNRADAGSEVVVDETVVDETVVATEDGDVVAVEVVEVDETDTAAR